MPSALFWERSNELENVATLVRLVLSTLNSVEVRGKDNLDKLLGSINALETVAQALETPPVSTEAIVKEDALNG